MRRTSQAPDARVMLLAALVCLVEPVTSLLLSPSRVSRATTPHMMSGDGPMTVERFVGDLEFLGPCRFVVVGEGAVRALTSLFITPALIHIHFSIS